MNLLSLLQKLIDLLYSLIPRKLITEPPRPLKIIAHRGDHIHFKENTIAAFQSCLDHQVYGIEFDIRWTKDNIPIVLHDAHAGRVFGRPDVTPSELAVSDLKKLLPEIPTLGEVIHGFGKKLHLMIEIKNPVDSSNLAEKVKNLELILSGLTAGKDYHIMSLVPDNFKLTAFVNKRHWIIISETNAKTMCDWAIKNKIGGITGHYLLISKKMRKTLKHKGLKHGTGFIESKNVLIREINQSSEWHYTNHPLRLTL